MNILSRQLDPDGDVESLVESRSTSAQDESDCFEDSASLSRATTMNEDCGEVYRMDNVDGSSHKGQKEEKDGEDEKKRRSQVPQLPEPAREDNLESTQTAGSMASAIGHTVSEAHALFSQAANPLREASQPLGGALPTGPEQDKVVEDEVEENAIGQHDKASITGPAMSEQQHH